MVIFDISVTKSYLLKIFGRGNLAVQKAVPAKIQSISLSILRDWAPFRTLSDWGGGGISISAPIADRDIQFFSGGSCAFLE